MEQTARIPFDDRRNLQATVLDISPTLARRFLQAVGSDLLNRQPAPTDKEIYEALRIVQPINGGMVPKNIGLLFFTERPERFFTYAYFEVVQFGDLGDRLEERTFYGPVDEVIREVIRYLDNLTSTLRRKIPQQAEVERTVAFPYEALEEAVVNAAYHRSYELTENSSEPCKIYLYPDRMEILSYPGPVAGITLESLEGIPPQVPARNRRIGEFLKELRLAEMRGTGIPKIRRTMQQNGSPQPRFDFAENYFRVTLPAHPRYVTIHAIRESSYLWSIGEHHTALGNLKAALHQYPHDGAMVSTLIEYLFQLDRSQEAHDIFMTFQTTPHPTDQAAAYLSYFKSLMAHGEKEAAQRVIEALPETAYLENPLEIAIALKRFRQFEKAHVLFNQVYGLYNNNPKYLQNYADTKAQIADNLRRKKHPNWPTINRLRDEAIELLKRAVKLYDDNPNQLAWSWYYLATTMQLRNRNHTKAEIEAAFQQAIALLPSESRFQKSYDHWKQHRR